MRIKEKIMFFKNIFKMLNFINPIVWIVSLYKLIDIPNNFPAASKADQEEIKEEDETDINEEDNETGEDNE